MGRVPKYRAWYKPKGVMIEPENLVMINFYTKVLGVYMEMDGKGYHVLRMSDFELLEYTGLKDINDQEIYEGDFLRIPDLYETPENTSTTYHTSVVDFEEFGFRVGGSQLCDDYQYISDECEVYGNIYENPELIEV
ncbi:YopX family protein [Paenibacillus sp. FSL K6-2859]|uniref:YopX family protein n=1 Tax=Paenibacillus sp. FSL K6-2859 TaxID=2921482 RepID=UPI0030F88029